jgi:hypothetical protein
MQHKMHASSERCAKDDHDHAFCKYLNDTLRKGSTPHRPAKLQAL